jgi:hypothetical protein
MRRATRLATVREHTGDPAQERMQRERNAIAEHVNRLRTLTERVDATLSGVISVLEPIRLQATGRTTAVMANANYVLSTAERSRWVIRTTGAHTANRTLSGFYLPTNEDEFYTRLIQNACSGAFSVVVTNGGGASVSVANGTRALLGFSTGGVVALL